MEKVGTELLDLCHSAGLTLGLCGSVCWPHSAAREMFADVQGPKTHCPIRHTLHKRASSNTDAY